MTPDARARRNKTTRGRQVAAPVRTGSSSDDTHDVVYFCRHIEDDPDQRIPGREALNSYPDGVRAKMSAALVAVASSPPKRFAGGGYWEAMKGDMTGWFELRADGPNRHHYRLYCLLDYEAKNASKPLLVVVAGLDKPFRTVLSDADYAGVRQLGREYLSRNPRCFA
jgi:hypothetical protein